jgi:hypothetical protein
MIQPVMIYHMKINNSEPFINVTAAGILNEHFCASSLSFSVSSLRTVSLHAASTTMMCVHYTHNKDFYGGNEEHILAERISFFSAEIALLCRLSPLSLSSPSSLPLSQCVCVCVLGKVKSNKSSKQVKMKHLEPRMHKK